MPIRCDVFELLRAMGLYDMFPTVPEGIDLDTRELRSPVCDDIERKLLGEFGVPGAPVCDDIERKLLGECGTLGAPVCEDIERKLLGEFGVPGMLGPPNAGEVGDCSSGRRG